MKLIKKKKVRLAAEEAEAELARKAALEQATA